MNSTDRTAGDVTTIDLTMTAEDAAVHDTLCALQAPSGMQRVSDLITAVGGRTARGTAFNPMEVKRVMERLVTAGHAKRDTQGRVRASLPHAAERFRSMMLDSARATAWFEAWRKLNDFDRAYSLGFQEEEQLAAAMRLVLFGGRSLRHIRRLGELAYSFTHLWVGALQQAVLQPFDAELYSRLEPQLQTELAERLMTLLSGFSEASVRPLEDWLLRAYTIPSTAAVVTPALRLRLSETLLFRDQAAQADAMFANMSGASLDLQRTLFSIAEGQWAEGAARFEVAAKHAGVQLGRRKQLVSPSMSWLYVMALLSESAPAAWAKARKFVVSEAGLSPSKAAPGKRDADPYSFWGVWIDAIDQRMGDAPKAPQRFCLARREHSGLQSLQYLHHLMLAAWLRVEVTESAALRSHADLLAGEFEAAELMWLARMTRRAAACLLKETPRPGDASLPFFVGEQQDSWRDALAAILALDDSGTAASLKGKEGAEPDRLIWVVNTDTDGRITHLEPMEQKSGVRGLGKPKPVSLSTLLKRKDLATHDAALLRAVERDDYGARMSLDIATAAPALVRHPHVVWERDPTLFIEVVEAMPALEIMTQGEHITFRLLDPVRSAKQKTDEANDDFLPQKWRLQRQRMRNIMLLADDKTHARLVRLSPAQLRVAELVSQGWKVPVAARAELDAALRVLAAHFAVASDAEAGHEVEPSTVLRAELTPHGSGLTVNLLAAPFGDFGPRMAPGIGRERATTVHQGVTLSTKRNLKGEQLAVQSLLDALDFLDDVAHDWLLDDPQQALMAVERLSQLSDTIVTEWPKGKPMKVRGVPDASVTLKASSKGDWLELEGELVLDGGEVLKLKQLLDLARTSRSRFIALGEGDFLALSDALRQQLADLAALAQNTKTGQRLSGVAALAWEASGHSLALEGDTAWRKRSQAWANAQEQMFEVPAGLAAELRDYQLEGYRWLMRLASSGFGAVLADEMGLGNTVQTLSMLLQRADGGPALVVAPTSVCGNWMLEVARFAPGLQVSLYGEGLATEVEPEDEVSELAETSDAEATSDAVPDNARRAARRRQVRALGPRDVLVCSYALLQIDGDILCAPQWRTAVLDEAQAIKNPTTRRAKAALAIKADFRLALTGTPIENRLGELWSITGFCNPGLLGSAEQFSLRFGNLIERSDDLHVKAQASRRLRRLLQPFLLRRTKAEVLTDLPPRTEIVHEVVPGAKERALLEALRQQAEESVAQAVASNANAGGSREGQNQFHVLAALTKLRRAACDPRLVAPELGLVGAKVQEFERLALELVAGRHKALVFSQFTDFLALLRDRLDMAGLSYQYLDGSTPMAERNKRVAAFQAGEGDLFLISLKAGGFGLNLTMADYVIITDPWWNPAAEEQASARAHRIGQQRPVTVYRLVTQGSIEEKIVRLHRSKRDLAEGILSGQDTAAPINANQLMELLKED
jgi:SNF2-related domain/Helicase conserved C-terminal domain